MISHSLIDKGISLIKPALIEVVALFIGHLEINQNIHYLGSKPLICGDQ